MDFLLLYGEETTVLHSAKAVYGDDHGGDGDICQDAISRNLVSVLSGVFTTIGRPTTAGLPGPKAPGAPRVAPLREVDARMAVPEG